MADHDEATNACADRESPLAQFVGSALAFVDTVRAGAARYAEKPRGRPSPSGAALAVAARYLVETYSPDAATIPDEERDSIVAFFHEIQNPDNGGFEDPARQTPSRRLNLPLFGWIIRALAMLGSSPKLPTTFMARWDDAEELIWWLGLLEWQRAPKQESLRVMNVGVPRVNAYRAGAERLGPSVRSLVNWLAAHQDRATGFWGPSFGSDLRDGLAATFHVLVVLEAAGQQIPRADKVATTVLDLWQEGECWGDPWTDMAGLCVLSRTVGGDESLEARAREHAAACTSVFLSPESDASARGVAFTSLSEVVTRLEGLRAAALLSNDPTLDPCRSWRSGWDPRLWACEW